MTNQALASKIGEAIKSIPAQDLSRILTAFAEARSEIAKSNVEIARIEASRDVLVLELTSRYGAIRAAMDALFAERRAALESHFAVIDHGIASNDRSLIVAGMTAVGDIVRSSPFDDLSRFGQLLNSGETIEI